MFGFHIIGFSSYATSKKTYYTLLLVKGKRTFSPHLPYFLWKVIKHYWHKRPLPKTNFKSLK